MFIVFIHLPRLMHLFMSSWYVCLHYFICPVHSVCSSPCIPTATWYRFVWRPLLSAGFDCSRSGLFFCSGVWLAPPLPGRLFRIVTRYTFVLWRFRVILLFVFVYLPLCPLILMRFILFIVIYSPAPSNVLVYVLLVRSFTFGSLCVCFPVCPDCH